MERRMTQEALSVMPLTAEGFRPYGIVLGAVSEAAFDHPSTFSDFRREHVFVPGVEGGVPGVTDILGVLYRDPGPDVRRLEMYRLTEQSVVPLMRDIVQVVALGPQADNRRPDPGTLAAFRVRVGSGICMQPGCFHASFAPWGEARCLMLSRVSTTRDLAAHLERGSKLTESLIFHLEDARSLHLDSDG
jgi:ureidoglycolate lyase